MTAFTDDDLKQLNEDLSYKQKWGSPPINVMGFRALLARLEAAEKCIPYHECQDDLLTCPHLEAWRKACGK